MSDDMYTQWLMILPGERPPDHYAMLGLAYFCDDQGEIEGAATRRMDILDKYSLHSDPNRRNICQQMMNQVAQARIVLIDPTRRAAYNLTLITSGLPAHAPGTRTSSQGFTARRERWSGVFARLFNAIDRRRLQATCFVAGLGIAVLIAGMALWVSSLRADRQRRARIEREPAAGKVLQQLVLSQSDRPHPADAPPKKTATVNTDSDHPAAVVDSVPASAPQQNVTASTSPEPAPPATPTRTSDIPATPPVVTLKPPEAATKPPPAAKVSSFPAGLVLYYSFEENTLVKADDKLQVLDLGSMTNHGVLQHISRVADGRIGHGASFVRDSLIDAGNGASFHFAQGFTAMTFVRVASRQNAPLISKDDWDGGPNRGFTLRLTDGKPDLTVGADGWHAAIAVNRLRHGIWAHVAGTYDGKSIRVYVNGIKVATTPAGGRFLESERPLMLGCDPFDRGRHLVGDLDEVMVFDHPLTELQIRKLADRRE